jgi:hypothetical protein
VLTTVNSRLLVLTLLAEGIADVAPDGRTIPEEVLCPPSMEGAGSFKCLLEVLMPCTPSVGLRHGGTIDRGYPITKTKLDLSPIPTPE